MTLGTSIYNLIVTIIFTISITLCTVMYFSKSGKYKIKLPEQHKEIPAHNWIYIIFCVGTGSGIIALLPEYVYNYSKVGHGITQVYLLWTIPIWALFAIMGLFYMRYHKTKLALAIEIIAVILGSTVAIPATANSICNFYGINITWNISLLIVLIIVGLAIASYKFNLLADVSKLNLTVFILLTLSLLTRINKPFINPITDALTIFNTDNFIDYQNIRAANSTVIYCSWALCSSIITGRMLAYYANGLTIKQYIARTILLPSAIMAVWIIAVQVSDFHIDTAIKNTPFVSVLVLLSLILFQVTSLDSISKTIIKDSNRFLKKGKSSWIITAYSIYIIIMTLIISLTGFTVLYSYFVSIIVIPIILLGLGNFIITIKGLPKSELKKFVDIGGKPVENKNVEKTVQ